MTGEASTGVDMIDGDFTEMDLLEMGMTGMAITGGDLIETDTTGTVSIGGAGRSSYFSIYVD